MAYGQHGSGFAALVATTFAFGLIVALTLFLLAFCRIRVRFGWAGYRSGHRDRPGLLHRACGLSGARSAAGIPADAGPPSLNPDLRPLP